MEEATREVEDEPETLPRMQTRTRWYYEAERRLRLIRKFQRSLIPIVIYVGIVGVATVAGPAYPDPTQFDAGSDYHDPGSKPDEPRWWMVDVRFVRKFSRTVSLDELKADAEAFGDFPLLRRGNRLSVLPVTKPQFKRILSME